MPITYAPDPPIVANSALSSSVVNNAFSAVKTTYNGHVNTTTPTDQHYDVNLLSNPQSQNSVVANTAGNIFGRLDQYAMFLADIADRAGGGTWATKYNNRLTNSELDLKTVTANFNSTNSTPNGTASTWAKRGTNAEATFGALTITELSSFPVASTLFNINVLSAHTGYVFTSLVNSVQKFSIDTTGTILASGGATFGTALSVGTTFGVTGLASLNGGAVVTGTLSVSGAISGSSGTFSGTITAASFNGNINASAVTGVIPYAQIGNLTPSPSASALSVAIAAGYVTDPTTGLARVIAATTVTLTAPITTNAYWALIYANSAGSLVVAYAAATNTITPNVVLPASSYAIAWTYMPANAVGVFSMTVNNGGTQGFILDARPSNYGGTGGSGGTGASAAAPYVTITSNPSGLTGSVDYVALAGGTATGTFNGVNVGTVTGPKGVKTGLNDGSILDATQYYIQSDIPARCSVSGTTVILAAGTSGNGSQSPVTIVVYNSGGTRIRTNTANVTSGAAPAGAGTKYLIADLSGAGPGFTLILSSTPSTANYQVYLGAYYLDANGILHDEYKSFKAMTALSQQNVVLKPFTIVNSANDLAATLSTTAFVKPTNMNSAVLTLAEASTLVIFNTIQGGWSTTTAASGLLEAYANFTDANGAVANLAYLNQSEPGQPGGAAVVANWKQSIPDIAQLGPGSWTVTQTVKTSGTVSDLYARSVRVLVFGA